MDHVRWKLMAKLLRIAEFRRALALCCTGRHVQAAVNTKLSKRRRGTERLLTLVVNWLSNRMLWIPHIIQTLARNSIKPKIGRTRAGS